MFFWLTGTAVESLIIAGSVGPFSEVLFSLLSGTKFLGEAGYAGWRVQLLLARRWLQRFYCGCQKFGGCYVVRAELEVVHLTSLRGCVSLDKHME